MSITLAEAIHQHLGMAGSDEAQREALAARLVEALAPFALEPANALRWVEHVAALVRASADGDEPVEGVEALHLRDLALAFACTCGDRAALHELERTIIEPLPKALARLRPSPQMIDELRQELREKLLVGVGDPPRPKLYDYKGRGPLGAWARVIALRAAHDRSRQTAVLREDADDDDLASFASDVEAPDMAYLRSHYAAELKQAFGEAVRMLPAEERAVLRSSAVDGLNLDQLATLYQVHRSTAARWLQQSRSSLGSALRGALARRLGIERARCESVVALVESRIDMSLERLLVE